MFPAVPNTQSFQTRIGVSVMAEREAVCNVPMGPQVLVGLVFEDLLSFWLRGVFYNVFWPF